MTASVPIRARWIGWRPCDWVTVPRCRMPPRPGSLGRRCVWLHLPSRDALLPCLAPGLWSTPLAGSKGYGNPATCLWLELPADERGLSGASVRRLRRPAGGLILLPQSRSRCLADLAAPSAVRTVQNLSHPRITLHNSGATGVASRHVLAHRNLLSGRQAAPWTGGLRRTPLARLSSLHDLMPAGPLFPG